MIKQNIQNDQIAALKSGDKKKLETLRYILAKIKYVEIEKKSDLNDEETINILRKQIKELDDSISSFEKGGRADLVTEYKAQRDLIMAYMPPELSDEDLKKEVQKLMEANKELIAKNPKAIYGIAIKELKPKADPSRITRMLQELA